MKIRLIKILFLCCLFCGNLIAQSHNPFEIEERLDSVRQHSTYGTINSNAYIGSEEIDISERSENNPFEVDHIPIRRSELKKASVIDQDKSSNTKKQVATSKNLGIFSIFVISLILLAIVAGTRRSLFGKLYRSFTNDNILRNTLRQEGSSFQAPFIILYIVFILNAGTLISLVMSNRGVNVDNILTYAIIGIAIIYIVRHLGMAILAKSFPVEREASQHSFLIMVMNILMGILLMPLNLIIGYASPSISVAFIYLTLGLILFLFIIRNVKGLLGGLLSYRDSLLHFFLYLCTFEIMPLLIMFKLARNFSNL